MPGLSAASPSVTSPADSKAGQGNVVTQGNNGRHSSNSAGQSNNAVNNVPTLNLPDGNTTKVGNQETSNELQRSASNDSVATAVASDNGQQTVTDNQKSSATGVSHSLPPYDGIDRSGDGHIQFSGQRPPSAAQAPRRNRARGSLYPGANPRPSQTLDHDEPERPQSVCMNAVAGTHANPSRLRKIWQSIEAMFQWVFNHLTGGNRMQRHSLHEAAH